MSKNPNPAGVGRDVESVAERHEPGSGNSASKEPACTVDRESGASHQAGEGCVHEICTHPIKIHSVTRGYEATFTCPNCNFEARARAAFDTEFQSNSNVVPAAEFADCVPIERWRLEKWTTCAPSVVRFEAQDKLARWGGWPECVHQVNRKVPEGVLVGGNHLANVLIGWLGPDFSYHFPPTADPASVRGKMESNAFDVWCCWAAIMRARNEFVAGTKQGETS